MPTSPETQAAVLALLDDTGSPILSGRLHRTVRTDAGSQLQDVTIPWHLEHTKRNTSSRPVSGPTGLLLV
ncbi:MAG TPA: hypothetical protein VF458_19600, partial [Ktedonobacteraceae bacterium]